jgi:hypothetical protein
MNKFRNHVCIGDYIEKDWNGLTLRAELLHDEFMTPGFFDCYTKEQIESWKRGEWFFGGLVVSLLSDDVVIGNNLASLWGIDCNIVDDNAYLDELAEELFAEAEDEARKVVAELFRKLSKVDCEVTV